MESDSVLNYVRSQFPIETLHQLYTNGELCDIQVKIGHQTYHCHRIVLASNSTYFHAMFTGNLTESKQNSVEIKEADQEAVAILIDYFYRGKIEINTNNVQSVAVTSSMLGVDEIVHVCCQFISDLLAPSNCLEIRYFAQFHHFEALGEAADNYIANHFSEIVETDSFVEMSYEHLINILPMPHLKMIEEISVFNAVMKWIRSDLKARNEQLPKLLNCVRLALIPVETLIAKVESEDLIVHEFQCQMYLHRAKNYHFMPERFFSAKTQPREHHDTLLLTLEQQNYQNLFVYSDLTPNAKLLYTDNNFARTQFAVLALGKKIFFFGGRASYNSNNYGNSSRRHRRYSGTLEMDNYGYSSIPVNNFTDVPCLNVNNYSWTNRSSITPMPIPVFSHRVCQLDESIYLLGGILNENHQVAPNGNTTSISDVYAYHNGIWSKKASMLTARANFGAVLHEGRLYCAGGRTEGQLTCVALTNTVEIYDPKDDKWVEGKPMNEAREGCGLISLAGQLYALGGYNGNNVLCSVEKYDENKGKWIQVCAMKVSRSHANYIAYKGEIWAIGGESITDLLSDDIHNYNSVTRIANPSLTTNHLLTLNFTSQNQPYHSDLVEKYDPVHDSWELYQSRSTTSALWNAVSLSKY
ncbi:Kelch-like protein 8 [Trichoplax sp. H2]|nr:Kelch-like protein 8 [Trichoplax sp. H2]|eukprot:RDD44548.1 Kelch-like protein 8 [Trichoplax sp. H2]